MPLFRKRPPTSRERTAADRDRQRLERERRRAERDGRPYDPSLLEHQPPAPDAQRPDAAGTGRFRRGASHDPPSEGQEGSHHGGHDALAEAQPADQFRAHPDGPEASMPERPRSDLRHVGPGLNGGDVGGPSEAQAAATAGSEAHPGPHGGAGPGPAEPLAPAPAGQEAHADPNGGDEPDLSGHVVRPTDVTEPALGQPAARDAPPGQSTEAYHQLHLPEHSGEAMAAVSPDSPQNPLSGPGAAPPVEDPQEPQEEEVDKHGAADPERSGMAAVPKVLLPVELPPLRSDRLPPPPSRRDVLLQRRARRVRQHRAATRDSRPLVTRGRVAALVALAVVVAIIWFLVSLFQPFSGSGHGQVVVDIPRGASTSKIGSILAQDGVVPSGFFFNLRTAISGKRGDLHSGRFALRRDMSYAAAIDALSKPPPPVITVKVLIPEGETRQQIAALAGAGGLSGNYLAASTRSKLLTPTRFGAPRRTPNLEGFLFPATYQLRAGTTAAQLVAEQLTAFRQNFTPAFTRYARQRHLTAYQLLTVASMVEREAAVARDRPLIAAVIYNRLRLHMPLGIDATIRYALNDYTRPLTQSDLSINSPYNSRTRVGLPPTPIGNPGLASISAAARPARVPYLFYVAGSDGCGEHKFSTTFAQFQRDAAAYQAAIKSNGGRVPTCRRKG